MDEEMSVGIAGEIIADLSAELEIADPMFEKYSPMIPIKVNSAIREVVKARKYPDSYSDETIEKDLYNYYSQIRAIALYDYNSIGEEGHVSHSEGGMSYSKVDRSTLFRGIIPISTVL